MCQGLTDEIVSHLFKIKSFDEVKSFTTSLAYLGTNKRPPEIGDELKVNYIVEGSYKKAGDQIKVIAQLIEAKKDKHIWLHEYDESYKDLINIQADIALQIAGHLNTFLSDFEKQNIERILSVNQEAQELIWQARYLYRTRTYKGPKEFYELVNKAIELDPKYAEAYAWLGVLNLLRGSFSGDCEILTVVDDAKYYLDNAFETDQNDPMNHLGLAMINEYAKWDYIETEKEILKAINLSPKNPLGVEYYIEFLTKRNRIADAMIYCKNADISIYNQTREQVIFGALSGNKDETLNSLKSILNSKRDFLQSYAGEHFIWLEEYESAKQVLENALLTKDLYILVPRFQACLALAHYKTNEYQKAQTIVNQLIEKSGKNSGGSPEYFTGWYYSGIGNVDSAFYWLEEAYKKHSPELPWLKVDPVFNCLKNDDRYWVLYERTGHKAYDDYRASLGK